jgi:hemerythrin-like metal-binding protein
MDTGDPLLDREHRTLVDLLNRVLEISAAPDRDVEIMHVLTDMYLYAKEHFFDEESLMERVGYPDRERHIALHRAFVEKAKALTDDCLEGHLDFAEFAAYLMDWLKRHIADEDLRIVRWTNEQAEELTDDTPQNDGDEAPGVDDTDDGASGGATCPA